MNYCSRCHVRLAAPIGLSGNIHHDRCAPSIKNVERDLTTKMSTNKQGRKEITSLLSLVMGFWAFRGLDFNHTQGRILIKPQLRQTGILKDVWRNQVKEDGAVHNRSRCEYGTQNTSMQFCATTSKGLKEKCPLLYKGLLDTLWLHSLIS